MDPGPAPDASLWWKSGVVYQVYPRSFQDSNGDGVGDLPGITGRLDHLAALGVDAIWISPFYPSPMKDFGYDVADYTGVDPIFGTLADFDRLLAAAHARGLKVIIDWVPNHTSEEHPWFRSSRQSRADPHRDFYVWRDPGPGGALPNNWLSTFGGPAWTLDPATGQYYLHSFLREQPDLNWRNPQVRRAMLDTLRFWLERGVDGFRIDVAHRIMKDPLLRDNPPNPGVRQFHKDMGPYGSQLHLHDGAHPDVHEVYREVRRLVDSYGAERPRMTIGEIHLFDPRALVAFYGSQLDELHMPFNFTLLGTPWEAEAVCRTVEAMEAALPSGAWPNWVLGNHDDSRIASRIGEAASRAAMMLLLTLRGTPTIYYGDEIGMVDVPVPADRVQDPWESRVPGHGRDPERTPMQWDATRNAGFTSPDAIPWLPLAADAARRNVESQAGDPASMLSLTRALLRLRRERRALHAGSFRAVEGTPPGVFAYLRQDGAERLFVAINFGSRPVQLSVPGRKPKLLASTHSAAPGLPGIALRADEGVVIELA
ncbi:MAG TPA: alpha-amylase family glycosyl hydrolase [Anaeromyxobacter sp.]|nr:alpha-amylase family glycosyl hydrolase [Anaeromyxobacter sp.]